MSPVLPAGVSQAVTPADSERPHVRPLSFLQSPVQAVHVPRLSVTGTGIACAAGPWVPEEGGEPAER